jgi:hypothetical protein
MAGNDSERDTRRIMRNPNRPFSLRKSVALHSKHVLMVCLTLSLLWIISEAQAQPKPGRPTPEIRPDDYYALRAKYAARLKSEKPERELRKHQRGVLYEDLSEVEFERWDRYWRDHLEAGPGKRGKMADMSRHLRDYYQAMQRAGKGTEAAQAAPLICPSAGMGNWTSLGPSTYAAPIMGKVTSVYFDPANPNMAYAGAAQGGLFKTVNNGGSWTSLTDASHFPSLGITSIAVHPSIPTTIYISTSNGGPGSSNAGGGSYGFGVLRSINGGTTWQEIFNSTASFGVSQGSFVSKIMLHPQDPNTLYVLALHYVFRSLDAGATWVQVLDIPPPNPNPEGCGYHPADIDIINGASGVNDSHVVVSTVRSAWMGGPNSPCGSARSFISHAGGASATFSEITSAVLGGESTERIASAVQPGNGAEFFFGYTDLISSSFRIKKLNVASQTASLVSTVTANGVLGLGASFWNLELEFSKLNANTLYAAGTTAYRIDLSGPTSAVQISDYWATHPITCQPSAKTHADIRSMTVSTSGTNDVVVLGSDGGIHKAVLNPATVYTPTTANWKDLTGPGLALNEFFDINGMQSSPEILVGGTLDNGTFQYDNGVWTQRFNYDGWQGTMNQSTGQYFGLTNAGPIRGMTPAGIPFSTAGLAAGPSGPVVSDPNNPATIYGGGAFLYKSTNFGTSWTPITSLPGTEQVRAIQVAPSNSNVIYVARMNGPSWNPGNLANRLFRKNTSGSSQWTDIGANLFPLAYTVISDIAVDPDNANRVWVSFNGYWAASSTSTSGAHRVYHSSNGGATWTDLTYNLLAFPVASLVYQRGSDDVLYASTDVGVFRYNKSLQSWECFNNQLPVVPVTRLEINYCKNKIRAATWGRGIYESDLPALPSEVITQTTVWSGVRHLSNDLTIAPGAMLILNGKLHMRKDTAIRVQRGATLDLLGGTITNGCGDMWLGIEVWGTASAAQNQPGAQGKVLVRNGATIENAQEAIFAGRFVNDAFDWSSPGGIVQASNSFFYNNRRSVAFEAYHSMNGSTEQDNLSYFKNCTFETNRLLNAPTLLPYAHISLSSVTGVVIQGCKFRNTTSTAVFGVNNRGDGVVSGNSQYTIDDLGLPNQSVFSGLRDGVRAEFSGAEANKKVTIRNSDFNNVQRGVLVVRSSGSVVAANNFNALPNALTANFTDATWGVRMNDASGFLVQGNTVTGASTSYQNNHGVIIDNCGGSAANLVKGNTLKNLYTGIRALGSNGAGANGVQFKCNAFQPTMAYQLAVAGPLADQGSTCAPGSTAQNTFFVQGVIVGGQVSSSLPFSYYASGTVPTSIAGPVTVTNCSSVPGSCPP